MGCGSLHLFVLPHSLEASDNASTAPEALRNSVWNGCNFFFYSSALLAQVRKGARKNKKCGDVLKFMFMSTWLPVPSPFSVNIICIIHLIDPYPLTPPWSFCSPIWTHISNSCSNCENMEKISTKISTLHVFQTGKAELFFSLKEVWVFIYLFIFLADSDMKRMGFCFFSTQVDHSWNDRSPGTYSYVLFGCSAFLRAKKSACHWVSSLSTRKRERKNSPFSSRLGTGGIHYF